jgi:DNA-binding NarL/FixJ family response regulator
VVAEDDVLMREGIVRLLTEAGFDVVAHTGDADHFLRQALARGPDVAVVDIQMPPGRGADGLRAALQLRDRQPGTGVVVLSSHVEDGYALELIGESVDGVGYLLKERIGDVDGFTAAVLRVSTGGSALDPEVVRRMIGRRRAPGTPLAHLTTRERDVLSQIAEGKANTAIAESLEVSPATVEKHVTSIFQKLGIAGTQGGHRRVLAALTYLRDAQ